MDKFDHSKASTKHSEKHSCAANENDVISAHLAWDLWKSNDPKDWDKALEAKHRLTKHNSKAWNKAMGEVDLEEEATKARHLRQQNNSQRLADAGLVPVRKKKQDVLNNPSDSAGPINDPLQTQREQDGRPLHPGYAPESRFAPPPPNSPAYDAAYNQPKPEFHGLDLGIVKMGYNNGGSLEFGANVGVASTNLQVGLNNRVDAELMPIGGPVHARFGTGFGVNEDGLHSDVGAGANFFNVVNGDADFDARLGRNTGVDGDVRGRAFPVNVQADAGAGVGPEGVHAYTGANTDLAGLAGIRSGAHFDLDQYNSGVGAGVGLRAGDHTLDFGPSIYSDNNSTIRPDLQLQQGTIAQDTFYPTGTRRNEVADNE